MLTAENQSERSRDILTVEAAPLRKQVVERLRSAIISFEYEAGQRLTERDLCERYGVSRTVIREALRVLEADGLVDLIPNRGPVVATVTRDEAIAIFEVRAALEPLAARYCAERATDEDRQLIADALRRISATRASSDLVGELEAKDDFFSCVYQGAKNTILASLLKSVNARAQILRGFSRRIEGRPEKAYEQLHALTAAIERRDADLAAEVALAHTLDAAEAALAALAAVTDDLA
jgi:DNA-binding GntR family transcriptional regulator